MATKVQGKAQGTLRPPRLKRRRKAQEKGSRLKAQGRSRQKKASRERCQIHFVEEEL